ncbi:hypothetical protein TorRG33x02_219330 [Trema orientale]|uniref:Uncharacterized protein n=1 Tax=Trema orientale TaxID=63057 RepID=A0A2P5E9S1_TREOI|nr:hypothetical protein TorRG33x02_219330 [Trema orientale]
MGGAIHLCLGIKGGATTVLRQSRGLIELKKKNASKVNQMMSRSLLTTMNNHVPISPEAPKKYTKEIKLISWTTIKNGH